MTLRVPGGIHMGSLGLPGRVPLKSCSKLSQIPQVAQTGLGPGTLGWPAQIPAGLAIWEWQLNEIDDG